MKTTHLAALIFASALPCQAAIVITEVMSSSAHPSSSYSNDDWFELTNTGTTSVNVTGWSWDDSDNVPGTAPFGAALTLIGPGESVILTGEGIGTEAGWLTSWGITGVRVFAYGDSAFQGLGAGASGDAIYIYDSANHLVTSVILPQTGKGPSLEWDGSGNFLGISVIGENGAFLAATNGATAGAGPGLDVGSPGFAVVPEPATALLLGIAGLGTLIRRRK